MDSLTMIEELAANVEAKMTEARRLALDELREDMAKAFKGLAAGSAKRLREVDAPMDSADFRAGLAFAAELLADRDFEA